MSKQDELRARLDKAQADLAESDRRYDDLLAQREQWWENVAEQRHGVESERDALSLLLRGMARKLVAYRKWTLGDDVPAVHRLRRELAETTADVDKFRDYLRMANNIVERRGAERDERQTRIDRALVECDREYSLGRVPLDQIPTAAQICDRIRAALVGDQPPRKPCEYVVSAWAGQEGAECIGVAEPGSDYCKPHGDALKALSGVALRDVEGRDDAAGDLP